MREPKHVFLMAPAMALVREKYSLPKKFVMGIDNNCDGTIDEGMLLWDGFKCMGTLGCKVVCVDDTDCQPAYQCNDVHYGVIP